MEVKLCTFVLEKLRSNSLQSLATAKLIVNPIHTKPLIIFYSPLKVIEKFLKNSYRTLQEFFRVLHSGWGNRQFSRDLKSFVRT